MVEHDAAGRGRVHRDRGHHRGPGGGGEVLLQQQHQGPDQPHCHCGAPRLQHHRAVPHHQRWYEHICEFFGCIFDPIIM